MKTAAIVPIKRFCHAKQRLSSSLDGTDRQELAEAMFTDVLEQLATAEFIDHVIVVTADGRAAQLARDAGVELAHDHAELGQSPAAETGLKRAAELGADRALLLPGDCPAIDHADLIGLIGLIQGGTENNRPGVTIVSDRHGTGTNALLFTPPHIISPAFGEGSFDRHVRLAADAGAQLEVRTIRSLEVDCDTPEDLAELKRLLEQSPGRTAPRTRAVLATK